MNTISNECKLIFPSTHVVYEGISEVKKDIIFIENNLQIEKNKNLESELDSLTYDEDALEGYARQELGLIKEGEIIIEIEND